MGWFKSKRPVVDPEPKEDPTLVRFANGKYGVRRRLYSGAGYEMLDMEAGITWWCAPKHWPDHAQADADTAIKRLLDARTSPSQDDVGTPV